MKVVGVVANEHRCDVKGVYAAGRAVGIGKPVTGLCCPHLVRYSVFNWTPVARHAGSRGIDPIATVHDTPGATGKSRRDEST